MSERLSFWGVVAQCTYDSVAQPLAVSFDRVAQQYAMGTAGIGTDQLWLALRQYGAATLPNEGLY